MIQAALKTKMGEISHPRARADNRLLRAKQDDRQKTKTTLLGCAGYFRQLARLACVCNYTTDNKTEPFRDFLGTP
jgi:hypothetical protein